MQLRCPECNAGFSLAAALALDAGRAALAAALAMPAPLAQLWSQYMGMFRAGQRALSFDRVDKLISELLPDIESGRVSRNGNSRACSVDLWRQGLERMVEQRNAGKLSLPLKSHGYLLEIVFALADTASATQERTVEAARKTGEHRKAGDDQRERFTRLSQIRGDHNLKLITLDEAVQRLRDIGYGPEALNG